MKKYKIEAKTLMINVEVSIEIGDVIYSGEVSEVVIPIEKSFCPEFNREDFIDMNKRQKMNWFHLQFNNFIENTFGKFENGHCRRIVFTSDIKRELKKLDKSHSLLVAYDDFIWSCGMDRNGRWKLWDFDRVQRHMKYLTGYNYINCDRFSKTTGRWMKYNKYMLIINNPNF